MLTSTSSAPSPSFLSSHWLQRARKLLLGLCCSLLSLAALADPSARVGRIAYLEGDVQFRAGEQADAAQASVNWPLTSGNRITTAPNARTEIRVGSSVIRLAGQSELLITALDDNRLALYLPYGSATVRIRNAETAREFSLQTPQGQVSLLQPGRFRIDAGRNAPTTSLHVIDGAARFDTPQWSQGGEPALIVAAGSRLDSNNGFSQITSLRMPAANDGFDGWSLARDRNDDRAQSVRYVSAETTGYEELDRNGVWRTTADYGPVWTPTVVTADWAPYRYGRWLWVAPWGWTWVDNASWGYAPSHYGRWVSIDNRWCWAPGAVVARPVWAPAVVGWQSGVNFTVSSWSQRPPVTGWFPLAPREVYVPSYAVSRTYVERVNITHVTNVTQINNFYRGRDDDRNHANYRYRAMANGVTPVAALPASIGAAGAAQPRQSDARHPAAQFMTAPGTAVTQSAVTAAPAPVTMPAPGRLHPDGQHFDRPGEFLRERQQVPQVPKTPPQALEPPHREQSGNAEHAARRMQQPPTAGTAAAPAGMPPVPVRMPPPAPVAAQPTPSPSPAEHHPERGGRGHRDEQRAAMSAASAPVPPPSAAQPPRPAAPPPVRPAHPEHREQREAHAQRAPHERNDGKERR